MPQWSEVPQSVIDTTQFLVSLYHPHLRDSKIGIIFRDTASASNGKLISGHAQLFPNQLSVYLDYDFIIWLAEDQFNNLDSTQRSALIDHQLSHCIIVNDKPRIIGHDIDEFQSIIERYGLWNTSLIHLAHTFKQLPLFEPPAPTTEGNISAISATIPDILPSFNTSSLET